MPPCQPRETPHRRFLLRLTGPRRCQLLQCVQSLASSLHPDQHLAVAVDVAVQPVRQDHSFEVVEKVAHTRRCYICIFSRLRSCANLVHGYSCFAAAGVVCTNLPPAIINVARLPVRIRVMCRIRMAVHGFLLDASTVQTRLWCTGEAARVAG